MQAIGAKVTSLETPCFLVDKQRVVKNCDAMRERCEKLGVKLRPMMKTHKTLEAGLLATGPSKRCLSASTIAEAELYSEGGFDDILLTLIFTEDKMKRLESLLRRLEVFHVMVDSQHGLDVLESHLVEGKHWSVFVMIDVGQGRSGVDWNSPVITELCKRIHQSKVLYLAGVYAHDGNSYASADSQGVVSAGQLSTERILQAAQSIQDLGIAVPTVGLGSTPTSSRPAVNMVKLTQLHPGNYIYYDVQQFSLGSCALSDIAGKVMTRITGHYPNNNQMLVDAGFLATSHDGPNKIPGGGSYCMIENEPNLMLRTVHQEVGFVTAVTGKLDFSKYPVGSLLFLLPWHSCAVANLYREHFVYEGSSNTVTEVWRPVHYW